MTRFFQRSLIDLSLSSDVKLFRIEEFAKSDDRHLSVPISRLDDFERFLEEQPVETLQNLAHPLSKYAIQTCTADRRARCSITEHAVLQRHMSAVAVSKPMTFDAWMNLLSGIVQDLTGNGKLRTGSVCTSTDQRGWSSLFPDPVLIPSQLQNIWAVQAAEESSPLIKATRVMVAMLNLHPFPDGNGRLSRIIFNAILADAAKLKASEYCPIYEVKHFSQGGFDLSIREVEVRGNWFAISRYLCAMELVLDNWKASIRD